MDASGRDDEGLSIGNQTPPQLEKAVVARDECKRNWWHFPAWLPLWPWPPLTFGNDFQEIQFKLRVGFCNIMPPPPNLLTYDLGLRRASFQQRFTVSET